MKEKFSLKNFSIPKTLLNKSFIVLFIWGLFFYQIKDGYKFFTYSEQGIKIITLLQDFITILLSIITEAFPFIVLGVVISVLVGIFIKEEWILKFIPKNRILSHIFVSFIGVFLPVCECGNVPVARRLMLKGFTVSQSITFLLSAPIVNPITYLTTSEAFGYDKSIVIIRILAGFVIANFIGILISYKKDQTDFLTNKFYQEVCDHDHHDIHSNKIQSALNIFQREFIDIMKVLCVGATLAALSQTFIPKDLILSIGQSPFLSIIAMILLAFIVSICSNVDAFYALTYANTFTTGSILAFLIFGPMIDIRILTMMRTVYKSKLLIIIIILVALSSIILGLLVNYFK